MTWLNVCSDLDHRDAQAIKNPALGGAVIHVSCFFQEIDGDTSTPPAFPFRVLYGFQFIE